MNNIKDQEYLNQKITLLRLDLNVPLKNGVITDETRINKILPIINFLIKKNSASKTVSIFFLIPATSAFMAWVFLNESLTNLDLIGFLITTIGVYIATRD